MLESAFYQGLEAGLKGGEIARSRSSDTKKGKRGCRAGDRGRGEGLESYVDYSRENYIEKKKRPFRGKFWEGEVETQEHRNTSGAAGAVRNKKHIVQ